MEIRQEMQYPPFTRLTALHFEGMDSAAVFAAAEQLTKDLTAQCPEMEITEPMPAPVERIKGKYRFMSIAKGETPGKFRVYLRQAVMDWRKKHKDVTFNADVDALNML